MVDIDLPKTARSSTCDLHQIIQFVDDDGLGSMAQSSQANGPHAARFLMPYDIGNRNHHAQMT